MCKIRDKALGKSTEEAYFCKKIATGIMTDRKNPIGIQTFSEIIRGGYAYVGKTYLVFDDFNASY